MRVTEIATLSLMTLFVGHATVFGAEPKLARVYLKGGEVIIGELVKEDAASVKVIELASGKERAIEKAQTSKILSPITLDDAARGVGLPVLSAWHVSKMSGAAKPVGKIAKVTPQVVYITLGKNAVDVGTKLGVFRKKDEIKDPDTGKVLAVERPRIAELEVTEVNDGFSKAKISSNLEVTLETGDEVESSAAALKVAVCPLYSQDGTLSDVGATLAEDVTTALVQKGVSVVERSVLGMVLAELVVQNTVLFEAATAQKLGKLAGASAVLTGKIVPKGKSGTAYMRLIDVQSGEILFAASAVTNLTNAKTVTGPEAANADRNQAAAGKTPLPKGFFRSTVVALTENTPANWIFKEAKLGTNIWSDKGYSIAALPKEIFGGTVILRDSGSDGWLESGTLEATKECTVYALVRWKYLGKVEIDEVTFVKFSREGWEEVDGEVRSTFPGGEDWRWKALRKTVPAGDVVLQLNTIQWNRKPVLFIFK